MIADGLDFDFDFDLDYPEEYEDLYLVFDGHISCCGATIVHSFPETVNPEHLKKLDDGLKETIPVWDSSIQGNVEKEYKHLYEVILTDRQMMQWWPELENRQFKIVARWLNSNSGNYCNLLVRYPEAADPAPYLVNNNG